MFKAWQIVVTSVAAVFLVASLHEGTPYFIALPTALLLMSVLAADPEGKDAIRPNDRA